MPCPHWTKRDSACAITRELNSSEEELEVQELDKFRLDYCLSELSFTACPTFKRHLIEQGRAY